MKCILSSPHCSNNNNTRTTKPTDLRALYRLLPVNRRRRRRLHGVYDITRTNYKLSDRPRRRTYAAATITYREALGTVEMANISTAPRHNSSHNTADGARENYNYVNPRVLFRGPVARTYASSSCCTLGFEPHINSVRNNNTAKSRTYTYNISKRTYGE